MKHFDSFIGSDCISDATILSRPAEFVVNLCRFQLVCIPVLVHNVIVLYLDLRISQIRGDQEITIIGRRLNKYTTEDPISEKLILTCIRPVDMGRKLIIKHE